MRKSDKESIKFLSLIFLVAFSVVAFLASVIIIPISFFIFDITFSIGFVLIITPVILSFSGILFAARLEKLTNKIIDIWPLEIQRKFWASIFSVLSFTKEGE